MKKYLSTVSFIVLFLALVSVGTVYAKTASTRQTAARTPAVHEDHAVIRFENRKSQVLKDIDHLLARIGQQHTVAGEVKTSAALSPEALSDLTAEINALKTKISSDSSMEDLKADVVALHTLSISTK